MYALSESLAGRVAELGIEAQVKQMRDEGYTIVHDAYTADQVGRIRSAVKRLCEEDQGNYFGITANGASCDLLLGRDPVFAEALLNPYLLAIQEYMCGRGFVLSQLSGSVRRQGSEGLTLHCDQDWIPAPFPEHNAMMTACLALDPLDAAHGSTKVIPGTHLHRRPPLPDEVQAATGAIPIVAGPGALSFWAGGLWHGSYGRTVPGERVLLHLTFCRLAYRPVEDYSHLDDTFLATQPPQIAGLLGRDLYFGNGQHPRIDMSRYEYMYETCRR
jgi:ectoine hydroxylase-related dioxygenase (phytanoyl-CoA dioxygenase family)